MNGGGTMKKNLRTFSSVMVYFLTPEDSSTINKSGSLTIDMDNTRMNLGSAKAIFWVMGTLGLFYLSTLF